MKYYHLRYPWGSAWTGMMLFCGEKNILLDSAVPEAEEFLTKELAAIGLRLESIDIVANTHSHGDHTGLNETLRSAGAEIRQVKDGDLLDGGDYQLEVIATPGHTPDSVCILEPENGILFTGDAFEGRGTRYAGIALYQNPAALLETLKKIQFLVQQNHIRSMYLGHSYDNTGGVVTGLDLQPFLSRCSQTVIDYERFLRSLPLDTPIEEAAHKLREKYGISDDLIDPESAKMTVNAHRRFPLASALAAP